MKKYTLSGGTAVTFKPGDLYDSVTYAVAPVPLYICTTRRPLHDEAFSSGINVVLSGDVAVTEPLTPEQIDNLVIKLLALKGEQP